MKRLILDHFRRWWWVMALCAMVELMLGWFIAARAAFGFDLWVCFLPWWGAGLLLHDMKQGALRAVAVLPLTGGQIGRSWWLATVAIPALALAVLLFLGAAMFCLLRPNKVIPAEELALASLFSLLWLGTIFVLYLPAPGFLGNRWIICALSITMFFSGFLFFQNALSAAK